MTKNLTWRTRRAPLRARRAATLVPTRPLATMPSSGKYASEKPGKIAGLAAGASRGNLRRTRREKDLDTPLCANACFCGGCDLCFAAMCCPCFLVGANAKMLHSGAYHSPCGDLWQCKRSEECMQFVFPYACIASGGTGSPPAARSPSSPGPCTPPASATRPESSSASLAAANASRGTPTTSSSTSSASPSRSARSTSSSRRTRHSSRCGACIDDAGERVATGIMDKKKSRKWTFNLDEISDDEDDEGALSRSVARSVADRAP